MTKPADPTREGHTFGGWYKEAACTTAWNFATDTVTTNTTLFAKWTINTYIVTFDFGEGTIIDSEPIEYNKPIHPSVPTPAPAGYNGDAWYRDIGYTQKWNFATDRVTGNMTLHAKLTPAGTSGTLYNVIFDLGYDGKSYKQVIENGKNANEPNLPPRPGYEFKGWYKDAEFKQAWDFGTNTVSADMTLYAKWTPVAAPSSVEAVQALSLEPTQEQSIESAMDEAELAQPATPPEVTEPIEAPADDEQSAPDEPTPSEQPEQPQPIEQPENPQPTEQPEEPTPAEQPADEPTGDGDNQTQPATDQEPQDEAPPTEPASTDPALVPKPITEPIAPEEIEPLPEQ